MMRANHLELSLNVQKNEENGQKRNARWTNNFFVSKNVSELPNDLLEVKVSVLFLLLVLAAVFGKESLDWWHLMQMCSNCITMQRSLCQESQLPK